MQYKKLIEQRKATRNMIKEQYEANKDKIKDIKNDKKKERRAKLEKACIKIKYTAINIKDKVEKTTTNVKDKFIPRDKTQKGDEGEER